ncbi:MAG: methyltransferase domain-containing protein [Chloroflexota bacterium]|nr:methyltransferase domain-containing protein [Chloroflexota bacterium]
MQALGTAEEIREAVRVRYSQVAREPEGQYNFRVGRAFAEALGYPASLLDELPASVTEAFTGVACPSLLAEVQPGQAVVDLGSGGGLDLVVLARKVGPGGRAIGVDFAQDMVDRARQNVAALDLRQTELRQATAEDTGIPAASVDWVVINGLLNLTPDKSAVMDEVARILAPGGRLLLAETTLQSPLPPDSLRSLDDWFR